MAPSRNVALLRGINVGGKRKLPMAELRALALELGWSDVDTYVQSGNLLFSARGAGPSLEKELEAAIAARFGFEVPVAVRSAKSWLALAAKSPFPAAESERPHLLHAGFAKGKLPRGLAPKLEERGAAGEEVAVRGEVLWIDYASGVARSKLTPALLDRLAGSSVTMRNWKTVQALAERLASD